jgi:hypothetical protein
MCTWCHRGQKRVSGPVALTGLHRVVSCPVSAGNISRASMRALTTEPPLQPPRLNFDNVIWNGIPELKTPQGEARILVSGGTNCQRSLNLSHLHKLEVPALPVVDTCAQASWCLQMATQDSDGRVVEGFLCSLHPPWGSPWKAHAMPRCPVTGSFGSCLQKH